MQIRAKFKEKIILVDINYRNGKMLPEFSCICNFFSNIIFLKKCLHFSFSYDIIIPGLEKQFADVAQLVERRLGKAEVTGSIPVISFFDGRKPCL